MKLSNGTAVQITSKTSKFNGAIGTVVGYCNGEYANICRVQLWKNKIINIYDYNLKKLW